LIFAEGDPGDRVYVIRSGIVKVKRQGSGGEPNLTALAGPGDIVGELSVFDPGPRTRSVATVGDVEVEWLDRGTLRRWMATQPSAGLGLLQFLARQLKRRHDQFAAQRIQNMRVRIARQLLDVATRFGVRAATTQASGIIRALLNDNIIRVDGLSMIVHDPVALGRVAAETAGI
jgi:CRP-like cAMP-binding protein